MKVREVIKELMDYNMDADVSVIAHNKEYKFSFSYGSSEDVQKHNADTVSFYVDDLSHYEITK